MTRAMAAIRLSTRRVEKPWGRRTLWPGFEDADGAPVGEIWFEAPAGHDPELLVKYLFTSERLSIQVHPDDATAQAAGHRHGKDEAWLVLAAEPESTIGVGLVREVSHADLRAAALDGSIETLLDWRPVKAGDVIYSSAGTIHAIGAGLTLIEVQQNVDLSYRLYDYGRPRALHLDAGIAVSDPVPFIDRYTHNASVSGDVVDSVTQPDPRQTLLNGPKFKVERWATTGRHEYVCPDDTPCRLIPVTHGGLIDGQRYTAGECWLTTGTVTLEQDEGGVLLWAIPYAASMDTAG